MTGPEIRAAREERGMTQAELAALLRVAPNTIARWERGERTPTPAATRLLELWRDGQITA